MLHPPFFSVVIPAYNRADTILPTLASVQAQTFADFECIVVDDGSNDSDDLQSVLLHLNDDRFRLIRRENGGGGAARNTGIDAALGGYIAFLDSDDLFLPEKLARFATLIGKETGWALYSPARVNRGSRKDWIRPDRAILPSEDMSEYLFIHNQFIQTSTIVIDAHLMRSTRFDSELQKLQDLDLCIRLHAAGVRFKMIPEPLVIWNDTSDANRVSRVRGYALPLAWLQRSSDLITERAAHGFKATQLAYFMAPYHPVKAMKLLVVGWWKGGVDLKIILRQFARSYLPPSFYRQLVKTYVSLFGTRRERLDTGKSVKDSEI